MGWFCMFLQHLQDSFMRFDVTTAFFKLNSQKREKRKESSSMDEGNTRIFGRFPTFDVYSSTLVIYTCLSYIGQQFSECLMFPGKTKEGKLWQKL
jgi:hypothetical protein